MRRDCRNYFKGILAVILSLLVVLSLQATPLRAAGPIISTSRPIFLWAILLQLQSA